MVWALRLLNDVQVNFIFSSIPYMNNLYEKHAGSGYLLKTCQPGGIDKINPPTSRPTRAAISKGTKPDWFKGGMFRGGPYYPVKAYAL